MRGSLNSWKLSLKFSNPDLWGRTVLGAMELLRGVSPKNKCHKTDFPMIFIVDLFKINKCLWLERITFQVSFLVICRIGIARYFWSDMIHIRLCLFQLLPWWIFFSCFLVACEIDKGELAIHFMGFQKGSFSERLQLNSF